MVFVHGYNVSETDRIPRVLSRLQFVYNAAQPDETNKALRIWSVDAPTDRNLNSVRLEVKDTQVDVRLI